MLGMDNPIAHVNRYRLFQRKSGIYFLQDNTTNKQESLRTRDKAEAERLAFHHNEAARVEGANRQIAIGYLRISDPEIKSRTWKQVMDLFCSAPVAPSTQKRKLIAMKDPALQELSSLPLIETRSEHFLDVLKHGTVSTNCYLRKLHNLARDMKWLPDDILVRRTWPVIRYGQKRAITKEEHQRIIEATYTGERKAYYEVLWQTGASQSDIALMTADMINWEKGLILFGRVKLRSKRKGAVTLSMGPTLEDVLSRRPQIGYLFPDLARVGENDRSTRFTRQCQALGIEGVTLHSYRYAVIQRAQACGYNKRYSMAMVGQTKEATHDDYAKGGDMTIPSLEECELTYAAAREQREKLREQRRNKVIQLKDHLQSSSAPTDEADQARN